MGAGGAVLVYGASEWSLFAAGSAISASTGTVSLSVTQCVDDGMDAVINAMILSSRISTKKRIEITW